MNNKIKGYKASHDGVCNEHLYEVGKTYTIDNIKMCERGFHFCIEMKDVLTYYDYHDEFVLFEVIGSDEIITDGNKTVCSQIEIVRIVPQEEYTFSIPLYEYDQNRNVIHYKDLDGYEFWQTYNENNKLIHYNDSTGFEYWQTYDEKHNLIHFKDSTGFEFWKTYDENNNEVYGKNSTGREYWQTYDEHNKLIHYKTSSGFEISY